MGAQEEMAEVRPFVVERLMKTRVVGRHLNRIFKGTKAFKHTTLNNKEEFPVINWDYADFSDWTEGYSEESRRIDITIQNISSEVRGAWLRNDEQQP
ncbi:hypothetical protein AJ80_09283 [Polytolypa hystricis UAMH7299]|uniref:Uncharacterized protein n=1 Tax=Polytolypa hystricis (strain UAMH7299) TaxID=1447883 RepID=A0A2B7WTQ7_POLH7|nr:hypothetical protein AJ80_09283 [Polytolypa hystricis UAMH7299]